jgi:alkylation response protein AidB-like acyl-CoA dehydrogenase
MVLPVDQGGEGLGALGATSVLDGIGRGGADRGFLIACAAHLFGCMVPIATHASPEQASRWLPALASGAVVGALAATEPAGGSSFEDMETEASTLPGLIMLRGRKTLICNAAQAGLFIVLARQFRDRGSFGMTAFLVPRDTAGLRVEPIVSVSGLPGSAMGELILDRCVIPDSAVLGRPGTGLRVFMTAMKWERTCLLAGFLGAAQRDLGACIDALASRRGGILLKHQAVSHRIARARVRLDTARLVMRRGAASIDAGVDDLAAAATVKLVVSEALVDCAHDIVRLLAGSGWMGHPFNAAASLVDSIGGLFASGTSEVQLDIIARAAQAEARRS